MHILSYISLSLLFIWSVSAAPTGDIALYKQHEWVIDSIRGAMMASIRTSWEQGTASAGILQLDYPDYSVFGNSPFQADGRVPISVLQYAVSAVVRQTADGRLSQQINDALDGAALDGASSGSVVLLGHLTDPSRSQWYLDAANAELNYLLHTVQRTSSGAISMRASDREYWSDGVFMGFPFLAYYGAVSNDTTLLQEAYDQCRLYRDALIQDGPTGKLWAHIYVDDTKTWTDQGLWASGNAWAALGMIQVAATLKKSPSASDQFTQQINDLASWVQEILNGTFAARTSDNLIPDYIQGGPTFGDCSSSAALVSVAYRAAVLFPDMFGPSYIQIAGEIRDAVISGVNDMGLLSPVVNPLIWNTTGILSTEAQAFGLMMFSAWRDYLGL